MSGSQKFIARNRAPRVQIEYDVELYGAEKKVQLPFVMGVFSDLMGKAEAPPIADRKFLEIDVDNFDDRMASMAPKAQFSVPNTLTGEGNLAVDLTFTKMGDFSPEAIAEKVEPLRPLLEARRQLSDLMAYMDGKAGAETLIEKLLAEPALLAAIGGSAEASDDVAGALDSLRDALPAEQADDDGTDDTLAALAAQAPEEAAPDTSVADALGTLQPPPEVEEVDDQAAALDALRAAPVAEVAETDSAEDVLSGIARAEPDEAAPKDEAADILAGMDRVEKAAPEDTSADVLSGIDRVEDAPEQDTTADVLGSLQPPPETGEPEDTTSDVLSGIAPIDVPEATDTTPDVLAGLAEAAVETPEDGDDATDILAGMDRVEEAAEVDATDDILATLDAPEPEPEGDTADDVLAGLDAPPEDVDEADNVGDILGDIAAAPIEEADEGDSADDILAGLDAPAPEAEEDDLDDILGDVAAAPVEEADEGESADDILAGLDAPAPEAEEDDLDDILGDIAAAPVEEADEGDSADDILAGLDAPAPEAEEDSALDDILGDVAGTPAADAPEEDSAEDILAGIDAPAVAEDEAAAADDILAGIEPADTTPDSGDDLDDILGGLDAVEDSAEADTDLDDILGDIGPAEAQAEPEAPDADDLDDILSGLDTPETAQPDDSTDDILAELDAPATETADAADDLDDILAGLDTPDDDTSLDDILGDLESTTEDDARTADASEDETDDALEALPDAPEEEDDDTDLDDILAGMDDAPDDGEMDDLDDILASIDAEKESEGGDALDSIVAGLDDAPTEDTGAEAVDDAPEVAESASSDSAKAPAQSPFGIVSAARPERDSLNRSKFRMAVFGDFTGRSARGLMETGDALASRKPIPLDVDTIDDIIEGFGTTLTLKIGKDGGGVDIKLKELDDLHPDELYDNIEVFEEISGLRQQLGMGSMAERATAQLKDWSETYATPIKLPKHSASTSVPANLKLSDFQALIGDSGGALTQVGPADDLIAQIVGPHIVKAPDAGAAEMTKAVDEALSSAMRLVLHHPDFQAIEAQWRSLDMLARRIETDSELEIILYDVSAEELAADLAAQEDLSESGLFKLVTDVLDPEEGAGGFSALFGLYTFEETPPHAELLARIGQVGAHVDAPFFSAITPGYLDVEKEDRHPLVAKAWDTLRSLPEAAYLALSSPRFLLRLPYGAKSEPIYPFAFEEFTAQEGLKGMLWANPVVLVAILLAGTYKKDGKAMDLGSLMSLGDLPFHYVTDRHGDQVALPCTERNLTSDAAQTTLGRGYMPVVWVKGRNEIRLGSFRSLAGDMIAGPWESEVPAPRPRPGSGPATLEMDIASDDAEDGADDNADTETDTSLDDLLAGLDDGADAGNDDDLDASLDDLLAGFDDDTGGDDDGSDDDMDPELAALLEGL